MTEYLLAGKYTRVELHHVRMAFSAELDQVGRAGIGKIVHLFGLIARTLFARFRTGARVLYYPPAGPNLVPFLRDCVFLIAVRPFFARTVFHFHAAGLPHLYERLSFPLRILFRLTYGRADGAIIISKDGARDAEFIHSRRIAFIPNGIPDAFSGGPKCRAVHPPTILFLGMVCEEKGAGVLIDACHLLMERNVEFRCVLAGRAASTEELARLKSRVAALGSRIEFTGPVISDAKWKLFATSDIFCFPTFYASESFGLVVVEAMMAGLPVVTSNWRALPEIIQDGETGFLTPVKDANATALHLEKLLLDPALRQRMGEAGRQRFLENYQVETFCQRIEDALCAQKGTSRKGWEG